MSEDYTWDETVTAHGYAVQNAGLKRDNATLAARVMELEAQLANAQERQSAQFGRNTARLADVALDAERQTQRVQELERENAELRARLEAVPTAAFVMYYRDSKPTSAQAESVMDILTDWMRNIYAEMEQQIRANLEANK